MKRFALAVAVILSAGSAHAQSGNPQPNTEFVDGALCIFDGVNKYRVTWNVHHLAVNSSTNTYYVATGFPFNSIDPDFCPGEVFGGSNASFNVVYTAQVITDPCAPVASSTFIATTPNVYTWDCDDFTAPDQIEFSLAEIDNLSQLVRGIRLGVEGGIVGGPGDPVCATISYTVNLTGYDFEVYAQATGTCAGGVSILVAKGEMLTKGTGSSGCSKCSVVWNGGVDPDPPPPPPPPPPPNRPTDDRPGDGNDGGGLTSGACCDFDGNCAEVLPADCVDGTFFPFVSCAEIDCETTPPPPQVGACCYFDGQVQLCVDSVTREQCQALNPDNHRFLGVGTFCLSDGSCPEYVDNLCCELMITQLTAIRNRLDGWDGFFTDDVPDIIDLLNQIANPDIVDTEEEFTDIGEPPANWTPEGTGLLGDMMNDSEEAIPIQMPELPASITSLDVDPTDTGFQPIFTMHRPPLPTFNGWVPVFDDSWETFTVDLTEATPIRNIVRWVGIMFASITGMHIIFRALERK